MESFSVHIQQSYRNDHRTGIRLMFDWLLKTREIIEEQYQAIPTLYLASDIVAKKDLQKCQSKDTWPVKLNVYSLLYRYFHYRIENLLPKMPDSLANLIPYNMWIGEYDDLRAKYTDKLGLEFRKRAIVNVNDNKKRFFEVLVEQCMTFCNQMTSDSPVMSYDEIYRHCDEPMTTLIHSYFQDYIARLQANSDIASDIDAAIINWFVSLLTGIYETYAANKGKVLSKCGRTPAVDVASMRFYLDICERNVLEIAHVYFQDCERGSLIKESNMPEIRFFSTEIREVSGKPYIKVFFLDDAMAEKTKYVVESLMCVKNVNITPSASRAHPGDTLTVYPKPMVDVKSCEEEINKSLNGFFTSVTKGEMHPKNEAYFEGIAQKILEALDKAEATIDVCVAWFTNPQLRDKLLEKSKDGVEIRVIIYKDGVNRAKGVDLSSLNNKEYRGKEAVSFTISFV